MKCSKDGTREGEGFNLRFTQIAFGVALFWGGSQLDKVRNQEKQIQDYRTLITQICPYKPVGNGGALAEMNGHITPERRRMYDIYNRLSEIDGSLDKK